MGNLYDVVEIRKYIIDIEEAKHTSKSSDKEIECRCDNCNNIKSIKPRNLVRSGLNCYYCSRNISYPEQFMLAYIKTMNLKFKYQIVLEDAKNLRFDFVNIENKIIIETHGEQHYDENCTWYDRTHKSDVAKRKYCKENGYVLIELDCRESTFEFIKNSIEQCEYLPNISNSKIKNKILYLIELNSKYDVKNIIKMYNEGNSTDYIGTIFNIDRQTIAAILNKNDIKIRKSGTYKRKISKKKDNKKTKNIICLNTSEIFLSIDDIPKEYKVDREKILDFNNDNVIFSGNYNNIQLMWQWR